jgi:hypothetical protein
VLSAIFAASVVWTKKLPPTAKSRNANAEEIFFFFPEVESKSTGSS